MFIVLRIELIEKNIKGSRVHGAPGMWEKLLRWYVND